MTRAKQFAFGGMILLVISILVCVESGRAYNNLVTPIGDFKIVIEMEDFALDFQLTSPSDPISAGFHGYSKNAWSDSSIIGEFNVVRLFGRPNGKVPYYSQIIVPAWVLLLPPLTLLFYGLYLTWQCNSQRSKQPKDCRDLI